MVAAGVSPKAAAVVVLVVSLQGPQVSRLRPTQSPLAAVVRVALQIKGQAAQTAAVSPSPLRAAVVAPVLVARQIRPACPVALVVVVRPQAQAIRLALAGLALQARAIAVGLDDGCRANT